MVQVLKGEDEGVVVEFVNPKYKAGSRTEFKKPTRLECMMQDFPKLMSKELGDSAKVCADWRKRGKGVGRGHALFSRHTCYTTILLLLL